MSETLDRLVDLLNLEQIELNIFRGRSPSDRRQRVFGGQVAGQALVAACTGPGSSWWKDADNVKIVLPC